MPRSVWQNWLYIVKKLAEGTEKVTSSNLRCGAMDVLNYYHTAPDWQTKLIEERL
jgi:hypothetical protein